MPRFEIPKTQKVAVIQQDGNTIEIKRDHPVKGQDELRPGECLVKMESSGCCHTDLHAALGNWPVKAKSLLIAGHEGVGVIVAIGNHTADSPVKVGDRVGVKWLAYSCLHCEQCGKGLEQSGYSIDTHRVDLDEIQLVLKPSTVDSP